MAKNSTATTGVDSLAKIVRRNLSFTRIRLLFLRGKETLKTKGWQALWREVIFRIRLAAHLPVWRYRADIPLKKELAQQRKQWFAYMPKISIICPLYNTPPKFLRQMLKSVLAQSYDNFELILPNASQGKELERLVLNFAKRDGRIKHLPLQKNMGIAENTNQGFLNSTGQWLCLLDHDDVLQPNALYEVINAAQEDEVDFVYSDEAVLSEDLKHLGEFHFKGGYGPDTLRGCNYIAHLCAFSRNLLQEAGGLQNPVFDGAQDYDLVLRLCEKAGKIKHIAKVLYFWRRHGGSTAGGMAAKPAAAAAGAAALCAHLNRLGLKGQVSGQKNQPGAYKIHYSVDNLPEVSVLIPSSDHAKDLHRCLLSLYKNAGWQNMEVLVLDNNSALKETQNYYKTAQQNFAKLKILHYPGTFNYSAINNFGAKHAQGQHLLLINNDVEIISPNFVKEMLAYSQRKDVGAVGAMLYYPDDTVQHAGLIIGLAGTAGVSHKGHKKGDAGDMFRLCTAQNVSAVTGAALMVKASTYKEFGGLDEENFAVAFNDVDFCLRLGQKNLWNVFTPFATAYHFESKSRGYDTQGAKKQRFDKESAAFKGKWAKVLQKTDPFYNPHFTLDAENFALR